MLLGILTIVIAVILASKFMKGYNPSWLVNPKD